MPVWVVVDAHSAETGLKVCKAAFVGAIERNGSLVDDGAVTNGSGRFGSLDSEWRDRCWCRSSCGSGLLRVGAFDSAVGLYTASAMYKATGSASANSAVLCASEACSSGSLVGGFGF